MNNNSLENQKPGKQERLAVKVEIAKLDDWQAIKDLRIKAFKGKDAFIFGITPGNKDQRIAKEESKGKEDYEEEISGDNAFGVLAWNGSESIGMGFARKKEGENWRLRFGYVEEGSRGGIQKKIIAKRLAEIIKRGGKKVTLNVETVNTWSIKNVGFFGFKKVEGGTDNERFDMELGDVNDPEVIKKIDEVLNAR